MHDPGLPAHEAERLAVLHRLGLLDTPADESFDRITRFARQLFGVPVAIVSLMDRHRQWFKSASGVDMQETPRAISFCAHVIRNGQPMQVPNTLEDMRFASNPLVTGETAVRFYAGHPLVIAGYAIGTLCLLDYEPRSFDAEQSAQLADLAAWATLAVQRHAEDRFQALLDGVSEAIFAFDALGQISYFNRAAERIFSRSGSEMLGSSVIGLLPGMRDSERERMLFGGHHDLVVRRPDGSELTVELSINEAMPGSKPLYIGVARDVSTSRQTAQLLESAREGALAALVEREAQLNQLLEANFDGLVVHENGLIVQANPAAERLFGYPSELLVGKNLLELVAPESLALAREAVREGLAAAGTVTGPVRLVALHASGKRLVIEVMGHGYRFEGGDARVVAFRDITARVEAEDALRDRERRFRLLAENSNDIIFRFAYRPTFGYEYVSPAVTSIMGFTPEECYADPSRGLMIGGQVQGAEGPNRLVETTRRDGTPVFLEVTLVPEFGADGLPSAVEGVARDVTARVQAEASLRENELKFRAVVQAAGEAIVLVDDMGHIVLWNPAARDLFGYDEAAILGRPFESVLGERDREVYRRAIEAAPGRAERRSVARPFGVMGLREDGTEVPLEIAIGAWDAGQGRYYAQAIRDVTERRELDRMKEEFIATVSHELRTPLNMICGSLDLLASGMVTPDRVQRVMQIAASNTDRLIRIVNDILDIQSIGWGKLSVVKKPIDLAKVVADAAESMRPMLVGAGLRLALDCQPATVVADADRLVQALTNLVSNAAKFSPAGNAVSVAVRAVEGEAHLLVCDRGRGIPPEMLEAVFERFAQIEPEDASLKRGTGLGLAICRAIAEAHGGRIWAQSRPNEGATFTLALPLAVALDAAAVASDAEGLA